MGKVLIIGAGGVGTVVAHKVAQNPDVFTEIMIASRTKSKCDAVVKAIGNPNIKTAQVDADSVDELVAPVSYTHLPSKYHWHQYQMSPQSEEYRDVPEQYLSG